MKLSLLAALFLHFILVKAVDAKALRHTCYCSAHFPLLLHFCNRIQFPTRPQRNIKKYKDLLAIYHKL